MEQINQVIVNNICRVAKDTLDREPIGKSYQRMWKTYYQLLDQAEELSSIDTRTDPNRHQRRHGLLTHQPGR